jgi:drug/metabolite transporter (DMT)-like permease
LRLTVALALWSPLFLPAYLLLRPGGMPAVPLRDVALQLVYHGWLVAFAATLLFFLAVRLAGLLTSSVLQALAPCIAGGFGAALLAEPLGARHLAGIAITTVGVILAAIGPSITVGRNAR